MITFNEKLCGFNFAPFCASGILSTQTAQHSLKTMAEATNANFVIFTPAALQLHTYSTEIDFHSVRTCSDDELRSIIAYAQSLGLKTAVKPTANIRSGAWRAYVDFIDNDVPGEACWGDWFRSYTDFQLHFAKIAHECKVGMFIAGCEMVMSERRDKEWRQLIADIRTVFPDGLVTYNTDKFQEDRITWWDCVDVIATSGYYPQLGWEKELARIYSVVEKFDKPLLFAEIGCPSCVGSDEFPNKVFPENPHSLEVQAGWYKTMFEHTLNKDWICGYGLWSWHWNLPGLAQNGHRKYYDVYGKPATDVIREAFTNR